MTLEQLSSVEFKQLVVLMKHFHVSPNQWVVLYRIKTVNAQLNQH